MATQPGVQTKMVTRPGRDFRARWTAAVDAAREGQYSPDTRNTPTTFEMRFPDSPAISSTVTVIGPGVVGAAVLYTLSRTAGYGPP